MYTDEDGIATKRSQELYDTQTRRILYITSILSWLGFGAAVLDGEYSGGRLLFPLSMTQSSLVGWGKFLWPLLSFHSLRLHWKGNPVNIYAAGLRGSLLAILLVSSKLLARDPDNVEPFFSLSLASSQTYAAALLAIIQLLFPRRPDLFTPDGKPVDLEGSSSAIGRYSMQWCTTALAVASKPITMAELPVVDYLTRSKSQILLVLASPVPLWDRIFAERYFGFVKQWVLLFVRSIVTMGTPYCIMRLLRSIEDNNGRTDGAWIWLVGMGASSICQTLINYHLIWIQWSEMGIPVRAQLIMSIFQKALRVKDSEEPQNKRPDSSKPSSDKPNVVSLVSSDTVAFSKFTAVSYIIPSSFVRFFFAVIFLFNLLGWQSTLVGMTTTALCVPIHNFVIKQQRAAKKGLKAAQDKKTKAITEALHALRQIKFSALEAQWEQHIDDFRQEEIKHLRRSFAAQNIRSVWKVAAPLIVAASSIWTYACLQEAITPSIIFPLIQLLPHLQGTLGFVPLVIQDYISARSNAKRMEEFLRRPEQDKILSSSSSGVVSFHNASIAWPSSEKLENAEVTSEKQVMPPSLHRFSLERINLEFPVGELSVISGKTGSGKSLLLAAIIGEVDLLSGSINAPSAAEGHPVAFVSQTPWLQNATIKDNILFGSPLDQERYEKVLSACALYPDLAALAKGDETRIGLRGVKLSGGQRARLSFGRALYSSAQLLVLDDIFSALDSHVSKDIFNALTGELCGGRTRILVTHHVSLCLPKTKYMVHVKNNTISYACNTESIENDVEVIDAETQTVPESSSEEESKSIATDKTVRKSLAPAKKANKLEARTDMKVYKKYFSAAGGLRFTCIYLLGLVAKKLVDALTTWLLGRLNSARRTNMNVHQPEKTRELIGGGLQQYFYLYLGSSLLAITVECLSNIHSSSGSIRASKTLFREMTSKVLRMPLIWLDTMPIGELLTAFTADTRFLDDAVVDVVSEFATHCFELMIVIGVGLYTSTYTSFLTVALLIWCARVSRSYIKARTTVVRGDVRPKADILEHFTSSAAGVSTIRAFGAVDRSVEQMHKYVDFLSTARRHFWIFNRWVGLQMSLAGIFFSTGTGIILLSSNYIIDTSLTGFSLTFSMGFSSAIFQAVNYFAQLESAMDSTGSILGYAELQAEQQGGIDISEDWPSRGDVEVKGLSVAYSADLPLVLKSVSFNVGAGKRLGIVGRTGAGKSSLALSILRLIEPRSGSILIDGIDISTVKLRELRTRIAFIPQDPVLFSGTVRSNLDYFKQIPEEELIKALRRVKLLAEEGDVKSGLFTLDSQISAGGSNMSQGQRQLLCLARVLFKKPKIMILDEATSAVDNKTDLLIQDTIKNEFTGTLIVVAHRLRTIAGFDQVMVMSDGKVAEIGRPDVLMREKGMFHDLVENSQDKEYFLRK